MSQIPNDLHYSNSHEWVRQEDDDIYVIGITDHAQTLLGDLVYIELPEIESDLSANSESGVVESVKAASDIYSPITGEVIAINDAAIENPAIVNEDPYGAGWLFKIKAIDDNVLEQLLDAESYKKQVASEAH